MVDFISVCTVFSFVETLKNYWHANLVGSVLTESIKSPILADSVINWVDLDVTDRTVIVTIHLQLADSVLDWADPVFRDKSFAWIRVKNLQNWNYFKI